MAENQNPANNELLNKIREARKAALNQTQKAGEDLKTATEEPAKRTNPLLKFRKKPETSNETNQPDTFSNPVPREPQAEQGFSPYTKDLPNGSGTVTKPLPNPVPMPGTVGKTLDQYKPSLPASEVPSENPAYRILGDRDLTREQTMQMIGQAQTMKDLERLQVDNDPEVMQGFEKKINELKTQPTQSTQQQTPVEKPPIEKPWWEDTWDGIRSGTRSALSAVYEGASELADYAGTGGPMNPGSIGQYNMIKQMQAKGMRKAGYGAGLREMADTEKDRADVINSESDTESIGFFVGSMMPYVAGSAAAIAAAPISAPLAAGLGTASVGTLALASVGSGLQTYDQYKAEKGLESDPYARLGVGLLYGGAEFAMERFSLSKLLPKQFKGKVASAMFGAVPGEVMEKEAKVLVEEFAKTNASRRAMVDGLLKDTGKGILVEGSTEAATEVAQEFTNWLYYEKEDRGNWEELAKNTATAFAGGALMGAGLGPLSYGSQRLVNSKRREQSGKVVIAHNSKTGEAVEIVGVSGQKPKLGKKTTDSGSVEGTIGSSMIYDVIRPNGRIAQLTEEEVGEIVELPTDVFKGLLNGKVDGQSAVESRLNDELGQAAKNQADEFKAKYEPYTYNDPVNGQMLAMGKRNGEPVFIKTQTPNGYVIVDDAGNESMVPQSSLTDVTQMPFNDYLETNAPVAPNAAPSFDPSNPIQVGEPINYQGENWTVTGIDMKSGTVQLESEDSDGIFETVPVDMFQQLRKPKEDLIKESTKNLDETGAGKLRNLFKSGEDVNLQVDKKPEAYTKHPKATPETSKQYKEIEALIEKKLGTKFDFSVIGVQNEIRVSGMKDFLAKNGGEVGVELADIIDFPAASLRFLNNLPDAAPIAPVQELIAPVEPVSAPLNEGEVPLKETVQSRLTPDKEPSLPGKITLSHFTTKANSEKINSEGFKNLNVGDEGRVFDDTQFDGAIYLTDDSYWNEGKKNLMPDYDSEIIVEAENKNVVTIKTYEEFKSLYDQIQSIDNSVGNFAQKATSIGIDAILDLREESDASEFIVTNPAILKVKQIGETSTGKPSSVKPILPASQNVLNRKSNQPTPTKGEVPVEPSKRGLRVNGVMAFDQNGDISKEFTDNIEQLKQSNDLAGLDKIYSSVRMILNGPAQGNGEKAVKAFEQIKKQLEDYAQELKIKNQPPTPTNEGQPIQQNGQGGQENVQVPQDKENGKEPSEVQEGLEEGINQAEIDRINTESQWDDVKAASTSDSLAELYDSEIQNLEGVNPIDAVIAQFIGKVNPDSYARFGDKNNISKGSAGNWIAKKGRGKKIDLIAQEASQAFSGDDSISPQDVIDFMDRYTSADNISQPSGNPKLKEIGDKYQALTGKKINKAIAERIRKNLKGKSITKNDQGELLETDEQIKQYLESNPDLISFLKSEFSGPQGISYKLALEKFTTDPGFFTVFPGDFKLNQTDAIRTILTKKFNEQSRNKGANSPIPAAANADGGNKPGNDIPAAENQVDKTGAGIIDSREEQKPDSPDPKPTGETKSGGRKSTGSNPSGPNVVLDEKAQKLTGELKDLWAQFGAGDKLRSGVSGQDFELAGKIIAKSAELGLVKFEQIMNWVGENLGPDTLREKFDSFKAAYAALSIINNPQNEDLNALSKKKVDEFINAAPVEAEKPAEKKPAEKKPTKKPEQADLFEKPKAPQLDLFGNEITGNESGQPQQNIKTLEDQTKSSGAKVEAIKDREPASKQLEEIDKILSDVENELKLAGYYNAGSKGEDYDYPHVEHTKLFQKDLVKYSKALAKSLGWDHDTDKKGKPVYAHANVAPAGGNGTIILWAPNSEYGVYLSFSVNPDFYKMESGYGPLKVEENMMWRMTTKEKKYTGLGNQHTKSATTVGEFAKIIQRNAKGYLNKEVPAENPLTLEDMIKAGEGRIQVVKPTPLAKPAEAVQPKGKPKNDKYKALENLLGDIDNQKFGWHETSGEFGDAYMRFSVEKQRLYEGEKITQPSLGYDYTGAYKLIMEQNYLQEGDLMTDPRIDLLVVPMEGKIFPINFEMNGMGMYSEYISDGQIVDNKGITQTNSFLLNTWIPNLLSQGRSINPNADLNYGKQGQRRDGQVRPPSGTGNEGLQTPNLRPNVGKRDNPEVSPGEAGGNESVDGPTSRGGLRPDNSGGTGKPTADGDNSGRGTKPSGKTETGKAEGFGKPDSQGEKQVKKENQNKENFVIPQGFTYPDTFQKAARLDQNIRAMEIVADAVENSRTKLTPEEKELLFAYSGFGGLKDILGDPNMYYTKYESEPMKQRFIKVYDLIDKLDPDGSKGILSSIKNSVLTAHFTEPEIIRAKYDLLQLTGFDGGYILEPSSGIGNYLGSLPTKINKKSKLTGIEMEYFTAQIHSLLYPGAKTLNSTFEDANVPANSQDLVISNIPFNDFGISDPSWLKNETQIRKEAKKLIHNYFVVKSIETAREGGLIAILASNSVMDTPGNRPIRKYMSEETKFLGAVRLPNTAFKGASGTQVVTDIIFLQKRSSGETIQNQPDFVESIIQENVGNASNINEYFLNNPDKVLGEIAYVGGMYDRNKGYTVNPRETDKSLRDQIFKALEIELSAATYEVSDNSRSQKQSEKITISGVDGNLIAGNIYNKGENFFIVQKDFDGKTFGDPITVSKKYVGAIKDFIDVRKKLIDLLEKESTETSSDDELKALRGDLKKSYATFLKKNGRLNEFKNIILQDIQGFQTLSLEVLNDKGEFKKLADIFETRTIGGDYKRPTKADTPTEAVMISKNEYGKINPKRMEELLGSNWEAIAADVIYTTPDGNIHFIEDYLSGNIFEKLEEVRDQTGFERNVEALEKALPEPIPGQLIDIPIGARFVDTSIYTEFVTDLIHPRAQIIYTEATDTYKFLGYASDAQFGTPHTKASDIIEAAFSDKNIVVNDYIDKKPVFNEQKTQAANDKVRQLKDQWQSWISKKPERLEQIAKVYNRLFNSTVNKNFSGEHLTFPGLKGVELRPHQKGAIARIIENNGGVIDHTVGAGKTLVMIAGIMEMKRLGVAKKPVIIVKKDTVGQVFDSFRQAYPNAKVLSPSEKDFEPAKRKQFLNQIAMNNWDAIILTHEQFTMIEPDPKFENSVIEDEIELLNEAVLSASAQNLTRREQTSLEKRLANLKARLNDNKERITKDKEVPHFGRLGIDHIMVDESQDFKNLTYTTSHSNVSGLGSQKGNQKTFDLLMKIRQIQALHKADKGVTFLSGTPISNSMAELYLIFKYLIPSQLDKLKMKTFDAWAKNFAEKSNELEISAAGKLREKERFRAFINVPDLIRIYTNIADIKTYADIKEYVPRPEIKGGAVRLVKIPQSKIQQQFYKKLLYYNENNRTGGGYVLGLASVDNRDEENNPIGLTINNLSVKATMDMRLLYPEAPYDPNGKLGKVTSNIAKSYEETKEHKGVNLIFTDEGMNSQDNPDFNSLEEIKRIFVEVHGIPANQIAIVNKLSKEKRKELWKKARAGEVRILIGGTQNMGTGVNIQDRVVGIHHLDTPWRPSDFEQRNGRGLRFGNWVAPLYGGVEILVYGVEKSLDAAKYDIVAIKQWFIDQMRTNRFERGTIEESGGDEESGFSQSTIAAELSGNPIIKAKAKNDKLIQKLENSKKNFYGEISYLSNQISLSKKHIEESEKVIEFSTKYKGITDRELQSTFETNEKGKEVEITVPYKVGKEEFEKPSEAGEKLLKSKRYSHAEFLAHAKGYTPIKPSMSMNGINMYMYIDPTVQQREKNMHAISYAIEVTDEKGKKLYPTNGLLSDVAVYAGNVIKKWASDIDKIIDRNKGYISHYQLNIQESEVALDKNQVWEKQEEYNNAILEKDRIAKEVALDAVATKLAKENNLEKDMELFGPMKFGDDEFEIDPDDDFDPEGPKFLKKPSSISEMMDQVSMRATINPVKKAATTGQIQKWVDELSQNWGTKPEIKVFKNESEVLKAYPELKKYAAEIAEVPGMMIRNPRTGVTEVVLVSSHSYLNNKEGVEITLLHEVIGHYGIREGLRRKANGNEEVFLKKYGELMEEVFEAKKADPMMADIASRYFGRKIEALTPDQQFTVSDEFIAHLAQTGIKDTFTDRVIHKLRELLRAIGFKIKFTDSDILNLIGNSRRFVEGKSIVKGNITDGVKFIKVNQGPMQSPAFKAWFGDSKVVDSEGKPLVVYHGTNSDFDVFKAPQMYDEEVRHEYFGEFIFLAENTDIASNYGDAVMPLYLKAEDIKEIDGKGGAMREVAKRFSKTKINKITNVYDSNMKGAQTRSFPYGFTGNDEYKYRRGTFAEMYFDSKNDIPDEINQAIKKIEKEGQNIGYGQYSMDTEYDPNNKDRVIIKVNFIKDENHAKILNDLGFKVKIQYSRTPDTSTIYVVPKKFVQTNIKSATGNQGTFDGTNPDIRFMKVSAGSTPVAVRNATEAAAKKSWAELATERIQDHMVMSKKLIKEKTAGKDPVKDKADFYTKENLSKGRALVQSENFVNKYWNPFLQTARQIVKDTGLKQADISDYLKAMHHGERKAYFYAKGGLDEAGMELFLDGKRNEYADDEALQEKYTPNEWEDKIQKQWEKKLAKIDPNWPTGMTDEWANETIANFEGTASENQVKILNKQVKAMSVFVNKKRFTSGMISKEVYIELMTQYKNYVPLRDWAGLEGMNENVYSPLMSAKGRSSEAADPIPFLFTAAQEAIMRGENNLVRQSLLEFVKEHVSPGDYFIRSAWYVKTGEQDEFGNDIWKETQNKPTLAQIKSGDAMRSFDPDVHRSVQQQGEKKNVLSILVRGKKVFIEFKNPEIPMAMKNLNQEQVPGWLSPIRNYTRWLSSMYTQYSPEFGPRNFIRDMGFAGFNISSERGLKTATKTYAEVPKSMKTLVKFFWNDGEYPTGQDGIYLKEYMDEGAMTGYSDLKEVKEIFNSAKREIDGLNASGWQGVKSKSASAFETMLMPIDVTNRTFENAMRFAYYKTLREEGVSKQQAAIAAKDLTVNFNRKGTWSAGLGSIYIFFNASVQGTQTLLSKFAKPETRKQAYGFAGSIMALGLIQSIILGLTSDDDDDGKTYYEKIPEYIRRNNIIIPLPQKGEYLKIPLPYGLNVFYAMGESIGRVITGQGKPGSEALGVASVASNAFSPLGGYDFTSDKQRPFQGVAQLFTPSALQPVTDLMLNQNFAGFPIYRENFTPTQYQRPDSQMYFEGVNPAIRTVTDALNSATGGDQVKSGVIDINPEWVEYGFEQYFGGPVQFGQNAYATLAAIAGGENVLEDPYYRKVPLLRSFVQKSGTEYQIKQDYYTNYNEVQSAKQAYDSYKDDGDTASARALLQEERSKFLMVEVAKTVNGKIKKINDQIGALKERDAPDDNEKIEKLYDQKNQIMNKFNTLYYQRVNPKKEAPESLESLFK